MNFDALGQFGALGVVLGFAFMAIAKLYSDNRATAKEQREDNKAMLAALNGTANAVLNLTRAVEEQSDGIENLARANEQTARTLQGIDISLRDVVADQRARGNIR